MTENTIVNLKTTENEGPGGHILKKEYEGIIQETERLVETKDLILAYDMHSGVIHIKQTQSIEEIRSIYSSRKYTESAREDLLKIYYTPDPEGDLGKLNEVMIGNINESVECLEACGCPYDICRSYPGVIVYANDKNNNKRILYEFENKRCCGGCCEKNKYRFTKLEKPKVEIKKLEKPQSEENNSNKNIVEISVKEPEKQTVLEIEDCCCMACCCCLCFRAWCILTLWANFLIHLFSLCFIHVVGRGLFCKTFTIFGAKSPEEQEQKQGSISYCKCCCRCCCGEPKGVIKIGDKERYTIKHKKMNHTNFLVPAISCNGCLGQWCCYDQTFSGYQEMDILEEEKKVGEIIYFPRVLERECCFCCFFMADRNKVFIKFPEGASIEDKYALIAFGVNFGQTLAFQGKSNNW